MPHEKTKDQVVQELIEHHFKRFFVGTNEEFETVKELFQLSFGRVLANSISGLYNSGVEAMIHSMAAPDYTDEDVLHIIDWLLAAVRNCEAWLSRKDDLGRPKKLMKFSTMKDIVKEADKAMLKANQKLLGVRIVEGDEQLEMTLDDGCYVVRLLTPAALDRESAQMQHCIGHGGYDRRLEDDEYRFWSLRDSFGKAHATVEAKRQSHGGTFKALQISGKQNRFPIENYALMLGPLFVKYEIDISRYERQYGMKVLGYDGIFHDRRHLPAGFVSAGDLKIEAATNAAKQKDKVKLPEGLHVRGSLTVENADLQHHPIDIRVDGDLIIKNSTNIRIASTIKLAGDLNIALSEDVAIEDDVTIGRSLTLAMAEINELPKGLKIGGALLLKQTPITIIPEDIEFDGNLALFKTPIAKLPANMIRFESLLLNDAGITTFPEKIEIGKNMIIENMKVTKGPRVIEQVGEKLDVRLIKVKMDMAPLTSNLQISQSTIEAFPEVYETEGDLWIMNSKVARMPEKVSANVFGLIGDLPNMPKEVTARFLLSLDNTPWQGLPEGTKYNVNSLHLQSVFLRELHSDIDDETPIIRFDLMGMQHKITAGELRKDLAEKIGINL